MNIYVQVLLLVVLINKLISADNYNHPLSLCYASDVKYESYTSATIQNCGCKTGESCVRRCCQRGFSPNVENGKWACRNTTLRNVTVPIYDGQERLYNETEHFLVGILNIPRIFPLVNSEPDQDFYIQENGTLVYPFCKTMYSLESYCVYGNANQELAAYVSASPECEPSANIFAPEEQHVNMTDYLSICQNAANVEYESYNKPVIQNCGCKTEDTCARKCCQVGFTLQSELDPETGLYYQSCRMKILDSFSLPIYDGKEKIYDATEKFVVGLLKCKNDSEPLIFLDISEYNQKFYLQKNGSLYYPYYSTMFDNNSYCADHMDGLGLFAVVCSLPKLKHDESDFKGFIHMTAKLITVPFLVITVIIYIYLKDRSLFRHGVIQHLLSLIPGNIFLGVGQYVPLLEKSFSCYLTGYAVLFFMTTSFFWMNVICISLWMKFRSMYVQHEERKKIIFACAYAWGCPLIILLITFLLNNYADEDAEYYPGMGTGSCFLIKDLPVILYYFGPLSILMVINIALFVLTALKIYKERKESKKIEQNSDSRKHSNKKDDEFWLFFNLLLVMDLNPIANTHLIQLISWSTDAEIIWYIKDLAHALYGIAIFYIFVCKKKETKELLKAIFSCSCILRKSISKTAILTQSTNLVTESEDSGSSVSVDGTQNKPKHCVH